MKVMWLGKANLSKATLRNCEGGQIASDHKIDSEGQEVRVTWIERTQPHHRWLVAVAAPAALWALAGCSSSTADAVAQPVPDSPSAAAADVTPSSAPPGAAPATRGAGTTPKSSWAASASPSTSTSPTARPTKKPTSAKPSATKAPVKSTPPAKIAPRLSVSKVTGISVNGETVRVTGSGFDMTKGIYVAFCVKPPAGQAPSPCGGGADTNGDSGSSEWISSNPPPYGKSLAKPYGVGGTFSVSVRVSPKIGSVDCRVTTCVIATRADHTRSSDRSQDVFIPIRFAS